MLVDNVQDKTKNRCMQVNKRGGGEAGGSGDQQASSLMKYTFVSFGFDILLILVNSGFSKVADAGQPRPNRFPRVVVLSRRESFWYWQPYCASPLCISAGSLSSSDAQGAAES